MRVVNATPRPLYPRETDRLSIVWENGWAPGTVWTGTENVVPTGIRSPDRSARSESVSRLTYPGPLKNLGTTSKFLAPKWWYKKKSPIKIDATELMIGICPPSVSGSRSF